MNNRLIIVISYKEVDNSSDWGIIHTNSIPECNELCNQPCLYYNHAARELSHSRENFSYSFSFIKENCNKLNDIVNNIIKDNDGKQIALAVHNEKYLEIKEQINNRNLEIRRFRHEKNDPDQIWKYLEPLLRCVRDKDNKYELHFDNLWNRLVPNSTQHTGYILSAFFPLHLELQLENNDDKRKKVAEEIIEFESDIKDRFGKLKKLQVKYENKIPNYINSTFESVDEGLKFLFLFCNLCKDRKVKNMPSNMRFDDFHKYYEDLKSNLLKITYTLREVET